MNSDLNSVKTATIKYPYLTLGFASIPCSIQKQVERTPEQTVPEWFAIERAFTSEIGADVSVVLTKFKSEITGKAEREIMLVVAHGWGKRLTTLAATDLFLTLCKNIEDHFEGLQEWTRSDNKPLLPRRKGWIMAVKGRPMGRKVLMPLVLKAASEWNWNTTEVVVGDDL
jgi:exopolyphosphatase